MQPSMLEAASSHVIKPSVYSSSCSGLTLAIRLYHTVHSSLTFETAETAYAHICRRYCERVRALPRACTGVGMCGFGHVRACAGVCGRVQAFTGTIMGIARAVARVCRRCYGHVRALLRARASRRAYGRLRALLRECAGVMGAVVGMCGSYR
jgi:hypothetical protein